jgi:hypothetical protein
MNRPPTFSTPHFDVWKDTRRDQSNGTSQTIHRFEAHFRDPDCQQDSPAGVVHVRGVRGRGPKPVLEIFAGNCHEDWSPGEIVYEMTMGLREVVGPLAFDQIDYDGSGEHGITLKVAPADCDDCHSLMPMLIDSYLPQSLRDRLLLPTIDDVWDQFLVNDLAPVTT